MITVAFKNEHDLQILIIGLKSRYDSNYAKIKNDSIELPGGVLVNLSYKSIVEKYIDIETEELS